MAILFLESDGNALTRLPDTRLPDTRSEFLQRYSQYGLERWVAHPGRGTSRLPMCGITVPDFERAIAFTLAIRWLQLGSVTKTYQFHLCWPPHSGCGETIEMYVSKRYGHLIRLYFLGNRHIHYQSDSERPMRSEHDLGFYHTLVKHAGPGRAFQSLRS